jgi:hypothetical protein
VFGRYCERGCGDHRCWSCIIVSSPGNELTELSVDSEQGVKLGHKTTNPAILAVLFWPTFRANIEHIVHNAACSLTQTISPFPLP